MDFPHLNENNLLSLLWIWRIQQIMGMFAIFLEILPLYNLLKYILIILILSEKDESLVSKLITWIQEMSIIPHEISWSDISVVQVGQVIQLIQVMQGRLAHLWPDFRVIFIFSARCTWVKGPATKSDEFPEKCQRGGGGHFQSKNLYCRLNDIIWY